MKVIDSSGWIEYFSKGPLISAYRSHIRSLHELVTPSIVVYEVVKKMLLDSGEEAAAEAAGQIGKTQIIVLDNAIAISAAQISIKRKLPMADAIIYATAQSLHATLVTSDEHFNGLPGVEYIPRKE